MDAIKTIDLFAKPQRNEKGQFVKGHENEGGGRQCDFCRDSENILKKINLFSLWTLGRLPDDEMMHMPYIEDLVDEDFLNVDYETFMNWIDASKEHSAKYHGQLILTIKKLKVRQRAMLLRKTLTSVATGAIFQLKANHGYIETEKRILAGDKLNPVEEHTVLEIVEAKKEKYE